MVDAIAFVDLERPEPPQPPNAVSKPDAAVSRRGMMRSACDGLFNFPTSDPQSSSRVFLTSPLSLDLLALISSNVQCSLAVYLTELVMGLVLSEYYPLKILLGRHARCSIWPSTESPNSIVYQSLCNYTRPRRYIQKSF